VAIRNAPRLVIVGAGPIGLEAAVQAVAAGFDVKVLEAGNAVADHVRQWGHVRLFTPFGMNHSRAGQDAVLAGDLVTDLPAPDAILSGAEFVERYIEPLAASPLLSGRVRTGRRVVAIARHGLLKMESSGEQRRRSPFVLLIEKPGGTERIMEADAVIDATGVYGRPNYFGPGGMPAIGERAAAAAIRYGLPDIAGRDRELFLGKRAVLIGAGYSAATSALALRSLVEEDERTSFVWLTRVNRDKPVRTIPHDGLAGRRELASRANEICRQDHDRMRHIPGAWVDRVDRRGDSQVVISVHSARGNRERIAGDVVVANVGFAPDESLYEHLQVQPCVETGAAANLTKHLRARAETQSFDSPLAAMDALRHPEPDFFVIGAKSFGRDPTFLLQDGLAQVEQVIDELARSLIQRD